MNVVHCSPFQEEALVLVDEGKISVLGREQSAVSFPSPNFRYSADPACLLGFGGSEFIVFDRRAKRGSVFKADLTAKDCYQDCCERVAVLTKTALRLFDLRFPDEGEYMKIRHWSNEALPTCLYGVESTIWGFAPNAHSEVVQFHIPPDLQPLSVPGEHFPLALRSGRAQAALEFSSVPRLVDTVGSLWPDAEVRGIAAVGDGLLHSDDSGALYVSQHSRGGTTSSELLQRSIAEQEHAQHRDTATCEFTSAHGLLATLLSQLR